MTDSSPPKHRKVLTPRRLTLLASVAGLGVAMLVAGPGGYLPMSLRRGHPPPTPPRQRFHTPPASPISSPR